MNGKRAKKLRHVVRCLGKSRENKYSDVKFTREVRCNKTGNVLLSYPVRTIFLVDCQRAAYQRLKRKPRDVQAQICGLFEGVERDEQHSVS